MSTGPRPMNEAGSWKCRFARRAWLCVLLLASVAVVAAALGFAALYVQERASPRLICLMYHRFVSDEEYRELRGSERVYSIAVREFERHLQYLRSAGYSAVDMDDAVAFALGRVQLPQPAVLITIDDGCRSALDDALPLLRKYNFKCTLFVTTDPTAYVFDDPEQCRLSDDQIRRMDPECVEIGAHGVHHVRMRDLADAALMQELRDSRATLQAITGRPVRYMAVPGNWYDERVLRFAAEAGFDGVCLSDPGSVRVGTDPRRIPRINVAGYLDASELKAELDPAQIARHRMVRAVLGFPADWLGEHRWAPIRARLGDVIPEALRPTRVLFGGVILLVLWWTTLRVLARRRTLRHTLNGPSA